MQKGTAAERYVALETDREPFLRRARACARVTVPTLMPDAGHSESSDFETPHQSLGARGLRTISSKLLLALLPPNMPPFRYQLDDVAVQRLAEGSGTRGDFEKALDSRARAVKTEMENTKLRPVTFEAIRQLCNSGNYLLYVPSNPKEFPRGWRLHNYVVRRDPSGNPLELVIKEAIAFGALPQDMQEAIAEKRDESEQLKADDTVDLFTHIFLRLDGKYEEYQEVEKEIVPGSEGTHKAEYLPYIPLRFTMIDGEDYGRSLIEEFLGDLLTLEGLSQSILEGAAASARLVFLVNPNGTVDIEALEEAENGGFVEGSEGEVVPIQINKQADLSVAQQVAQDIVRRLSLSFMMYQAVQRDAERVTATEIARLTEELDDALGGVYSLLSVEFQLPLVRLYERRMERAKNVPPLPKKVDIKPVIITGIEALGRQREAQALDELVAGVAQFIPPEQIPKAINLREYFKRRAAARGIDTEGLIPDEQETAQQQQMEQMMELLKQALPQLIAQGGGMAKEGMKQQQEQQQQGE